MLTAEQTGSKAWSPKNDGNRYEPMLTLRQGLMRSKNMVSIRILQAIGPQYAQDYLTRFGFDKARWPAVLPLALGAGGATPLQVVNGYSVFANGGYRVTPFLIDRVTDRSGHVLMQAQPVVAGDAAARAIDPRTAWVMDGILRDAATSGTGARAHQQLKRNDVGGKTGTTNEAVDVWFSGFTPTLATTVWMGFDQPRSLGTNEFGSGLALSTWLDYMQPVLKGVPESKPAPRPDGLLVDNGEFYFSEFPPGQAVASLDLSSGDPLTDFLNNNRSTGGVDNTVRPLPTPGAALPGAGQPGAGPAAAGQPAIAQPDQAQPQGLPAQAPVAQPLPVPTPGAVPGRAQGQSPARPRGRRPRLPAHPRAARVIRCGAGSGPAPAVPPAQDRFEEEPP